MRCLCCNKVIANPGDYEKTVFWHKKCIKKFFGTDKMPEIDLSEKAIEHLANNAVNKGITVPGVQKKLSLHLETVDKNAKLTIVDHPTGYILKPYSDEYECLPESEYLSMQMAEDAKIKTVPHALIVLNDKYSYITRRIDRKADELYAMEDFCQLSGRQTDDKYRSSYETCGKVIKKYSKNTGLDLTELFYRLLFCFVTGNSDMHLKNFSLIEDSPHSRIYNLSPAYDLLPVNIIMPADDEQMALSLNGKKKNIRKKDFLALAENFEISEKTALRLIEKMLSYKETFLRETEESYISDEMKTALKDLIAERMRVLI